MSLLDNFSLLDNDKKRELVDGLDYQNLPLDITENQNELLNLIEYTKKLGQEYTCLVKELTNKLQGDTDDTTTTKSPEIFFR